MPNKSALAAALLAAVSVLPAAAAHAAGGYQIYVSNERSGDVTVIDGSTSKAVATFPVGKRRAGALSVQRQLVSSWRRMRQAGQARPRGIPLGQGG